MTSFSKHAVDTGTADSLSDSRRVSTHRNVLPPNFPSAGNGSANLYEGPFPIFCALRSPERLPARCLFPLSEDPSPRHVPLFSSSYTTPFHELFEFLYELIVPSPGMRCFSFPAHRKRFSSPASLLGNVPHLRST